MDNNIFILGIHFATLKMSLRFRFIQLKRNKFAKIAIGTFIILLLLLALYHRSENIQNSRQSRFTKHSRFTSQEVLNFVILHLFVEYIINFKIV